MTDRSWFPVDRSLRDEILAKETMGRSGGLRGANQHRLAVVAVCVEAPAVSIGGGGLILDIVLVGEVKRMSVRCVELVSVKSFYTQGLAGAVILGIRAAGGGGE
jgi:hypothetical protein